MILFLLFMCFSLEAAQGYRYIPAPSKFNTEQEVLAYQMLLHNCKMIKQNMKVIGDTRISLEDAIQTSITLYLKGMNGEPAIVLLEELQKNGFKL